MDFDGAEAQEAFEEDTKSGISAEEIDCKEDEGDDNLFYEDGKRWVKIG